MKRAGFDQETAIWFKSSFSTGSANCVEIADTADISAIRDTKHRDLATLTFPQPEWRAFLSAVKDGGL
ncbi:hypothetical protein GCM10027570_00750 [Streptomonospora sediminis]